MRIGLRKRSATARRPEADCRGRQLSGGHSEPLRVSLGRFEPV